MSATPYIIPSATEDPPWIRRLLIVLVFCILGILVVIPAIVVFYEALRKGWSLYFQSFTDPYSLHAIQLTLLVAAISVPLNTLFGVTAAWVITRYQFRGTQLLTSIIDLPISVSPVIGGLIYVLLYGLHGWFGPWLYEHDIQIIFAVPGVVMATVFVTFPYVARGLIPLMQAQGQAEEEAALTLGAKGGQIFWRITLPKIKWGLLYSVILCNARAMGEFGAVSVVSGHIRGQTNTLPLHIEILHHEYNAIAAFSLASLLAGLAIVTLIVKSIAEAIAKHQLRATQEAF
jgi:sulfate transport system permease protein